MIRSIFLLIFVSLALSACGFQPLNAKKTLVDQRNATILILPIADRAGQILHNHLRDDLNPYGMPEAPDYKLLVTLSQRSGGVAGRTSAQTTRRFLEVTADYRLLDARNDREIFASTAVSRTNFAAYIRTFDAVPAEEAARNNVLKLLSGEISRALSLRLARLEGR